MAETEGKTPPGEARLDSQKREKKKETKKRERSLEREEKARKIQPKKKLVDLYELTGMDPDPKVRRRLRRKGRRIAAKRKKSKKKRSSSKGSSTGQSTTSSTAEEEEAQPLSRRGLFSETSVVRKISSELPGVLAAAWMEECQQYLLDSTGAR